MRLPLFAAASRAGLAWLTGAAIIGCGVIASDFLGSRLSVWYSAPLVLEIAYVWLLVTFAYKTSILRRDGTYQQRVTFLPPLAPPKRGAAAICFEKVYYGGVPSGNYYYPVQVRFADDTGYDLVYSAGGLDEARALATRVAAATGLPLEPRIAHGVSSGRAVLIFLVIAMCAFPVVYVASLFLFAHVGG